jgi:hypothetical protein
MSRTMRTDPEQQFCTECEVTKSLHWEPDNPTPEDCESAGLKADLLARLPF